MKEELLNMAYMPPADNSQGDGGGRWGDSWFDRYLFVSATVALVAFTLFRWPAFIARLCRSRGNAADASNPAYGSIND